MRRSDLVSHLIRRLGRRDHGRFVNKTRDMSIGGGINAAVGIQFLTAEQMSRFVFNLARKGLEICVAPDRTRLHFWLTAAGLELNNEPALWRFHIV
ncbi:hypothetical protein ASE71_13930 [Ensifer sp. Root954]|nr:hypothetical protein ASD49_18850 [Ensifer sp. Root1298]KQX84178.1 hypothetical protein ASD41_31890 [Ensifer sp. Root1312]KRC22380.1 hypothetical protein ASE29_29880 [Ensifer sp. Root74]KRD56825.1 hypothetical protein ASE71_13930 [Ensifer sp. Root954]